ncbi:MAG: flagellar hook-length control protein FliK [Gammaproteobacteria bacterium]|nr:flagellar hook-length control protein FliK [Gammaproteobacteria bacterium]
MQINTGQSSVSTVTPQITVPTGQAAAQALSPGQQVTATVLTATANGQVSLNVNNSQIQASTDLVLTEGQLLNLIVSQVGKQTVLKLSDNSLHAALISQALRTSLPKQGSLTDILANLRAIVDQPKSASALPLPNLPPAVQQVAKQLLTQLPEARQITTAAGLKEALKNSGIFLEEKLKNLTATNTQAKAPNSLTQDFKNNLLQLRQELLNALSSQSGVKNNPSPALPTAALEKIANLQTASTDKQTSTSAPITANKQAAITAEVLDAKLTTTTAQISAKDAGTGATASSTELPQIISAIKQNLASATALPDKVKNQLIALMKQLDVIAPSIPSSPSTQPLPAKTMEALQRLQLDIRALGGLLESLPISTTPGTMALRNNLGALDHLFMQLFRGPRTTASAHDTLQPPLPRSQLQAQATPPPSLNNINNTQDAVHELLRQTDAALARVQTQQTGSLLEQEAGRLLINAEIPLRRGEQIDLLQLRVQEDEGENGNSKFENGLTVTLSLDLEGTGPIYARINVRKQSVSVVFWAEDNHTLQTAIQNSDDLEQRLTRAGLKPEQMSFLEGKPPKTSLQNDLTALNSSILDVKA